MRQRGEGDRQWATGIGGTALRGLNNDRHRWRCLHRLRVLHLQLNCSRGGDTAASYRARQGIAIDRRRGKRGTIPKNGCLRRKVCSRDFHGRGLTAGRDLIRSNLSNAGSRCSLLVCGLRCWTGCTAETIKKEGGSCTCRDCLKNFAQIAPRGNQTCQHRRGRGSLKEALPGHSVERYSEKVTSTLAQKS